MNYLENILQDLLTEFVEDRIFEVNYLIDPNASHLFNKFNTSAIKTKLSKTENEQKITGKVFAYGFAKKYGWISRYLYSPGIAERKRSKLDSHCPR